MVFMLSAFALLIIFACVFGIYIESGGKIEIILHAMPHELGTILGAAIGAYVISNQTTILKTTFKQLTISFKGVKWNKQDYQDLLCLLFTLCKMMKSKGLIAVEAHIENPTTSTVFQHYPKIAHDHFTIEIICDTLRTLTMGLENPHQIEDLIEKQIEKHHHEASGVGHALQGMADGLPAIGIVAAVLGVVKTMASITEPPAILGAMIGGALVGTFLGVFLAYCIVGPLAAKNLAIHEEEQQFYFIIRDVLIAHLKGMAPQVSTEIGRSQVPSHLQPTFAQMEEATSNVKID
jgi:chemotaxis protein MotA